MTVREKWQREKSEGAWQTETKASLEAETIESKDQGGTCAQAGAKKLKKTWHLLSCKIFFEVRAAMGQATTSRCILHHQNARLNWNATVTPWRNAPKPLEQFSPKKCYTHLTPDRHLLPNVSFVTSFAWHVTRSQHHHRHQHHHHHRHHHYHHHHQGPPGVQLLNAETGKQSHACSVRVPNPGI